MNETPSNYVTQISASSANYEYLLLIMPRSCVGSHILFRKSCQQSSVEFVGLTTWWINV